MSSRRAWEGDVDAGLVLVLQIAAAGLLAFFVLIGGALIWDAATSPTPGISNNTQTLLLTLTGGVFSLLSAVVGRYFAGRRAS